MTHSPKRQQKKATQRAACQVPLLFALLGVALLLSGCASVSPGMSPARRDACTQKAAQALRFQSRPDATRQYFSRLTTLEGRELRRHMGRHYEVLGENVSSVLLMLGGPHAEHLSLGLNPDTALVARTIEDRVRLGRSPVEIADVASIQVDGEFLRLDFLPGGVATGHVYVICTHFEGRSLADQTFVDYSRGNGETQKLSLSALIRLLSE